MNVCGLNTQLTAKKRREELGLNKGQEFFPIFVGDD